ncbi:unnamed protein product [Tuber aestivum]|uniref:Uncharacterized protein n=1 Tax=Tuber aestivum TaxID=59557 RepID=A0A292PRB6_9PEZI|nr:unnamed protein product [Tuber aestivum]
MAKRKRAQNVLPPTSPVGSTPGTDPPKSTMGKSAKPRIKRPNATVYDAVASRVNYAGMIRTGFEDKHGEFRRRSTRAVPADEVLARRKNAPEVIPYGEGIEEALPDTYSSDFYEANGMGPASYRSMDETALLGIGGTLLLDIVVGIELTGCVLLEETVRTYLGKEGELALIDEEVFDPIDPYDIRKQRSLAYSQSQREAANLKRVKGQTEGKKKKKKKVIKSEDEGVETKATFGVEVRDDRGGAAGEKEEEFTKGRRKGSSRRKQEVQGEGSGRPTGD